MTIENETKFHAPLSFKGHKPHNPETIPLAIDGLETTEFLWKYLGVVFPLSKDAQLLAITWKGLYPGDNFNIKLIYVTVCLWQYITALSVIIISLWFYLTCSWRINGAKGRQEGWKAWMTSAKKGWPMNSSQQHQIKEELCFSLRRPAKLLLSLYSVITCTQLSICHRPCQNSYTFLV